MSFRQRPLVSGPSTCGLFDKLPPELLFELFDCLDLPDVGMLSLASEGMRIKVAKWMSSRCCLTRVFEPADAFPLTSLSFSKQAFKNYEAIALCLKQSKLSHFGILCKRVTSLYPTRERIVMAFRMFKDAISFQQKLRADSGDNPDWNHFCEIMEFFIMFHTFVRGWDESEYPRLFHALNRKFQVSRKIEKVLTASQHQDICLSSEMKLRTFIRCLTWDFAGSDYGLRASWILMVMKFLVASDTHHQAMVFLLTFGLSCEDSDNHFLSASSLSSPQRIVLNELFNHTDWQCYTDMAADNYATGKKMFFVLAQAICCCMNANPVWKEANLTNILDHIFLLPKPWPKENIAGFLLFCSEGLILFYLTQKLLTGKFKDFNTAVSYMMYMVIMSCKFDNIVCKERGIGKVFNLICSQPILRAIREKFFDALAISFINEIDLEDSQLDEDEIDEILYSFGCHVMSWRFIDGPAAETTTVNKTITYSFEEESMEE